MRTIFKRMFYSGKWSKKALAFFEWDRNLRYLQKLKLLYSGNSYHAEPCNRIQ